MKKYGKKTKHYVFLSFLILFFSLISQEVHAANCAGVEQSKNMCVSSFNELNAITVTEQSDGSVNLTITGDATHKGELCIVVDPKFREEFGVGFSSRQLIDRREMRKIVVPENGSKTEVFNLSRGVHDFSIFRVNADVPGTELSQLECGNTRVEVKNNTAPTDPPSPPRNGDCRYIGESCVENDVTPLCDNLNTVCSRGIVIRKDLSSESGSTAQDLAKNLSGNCGFHSEACCSLDVDALLEKEPPFSILENHSILGRLFDWSKSIRGVIFGELETAVTTVAGNRTLCRGNLETSLKLIGGTTTPGLNEYDNDLEAYSTLKNCEQYRRETRLYYECLANPKTTIPKSQVESCTCIDKEQTEEDPRDMDQGEAFDHDPAMIRNQICGSNAECTACLEAGHYYQGFLTTPNKCTTDEETASQKLSEYLEGKLSTQNQSERQNIAKNSPSVLGAISSLCSRYNDNVDADQRKACEQCIADGKFMDITGCNDEPLATGNSRRLCQNIENGEEQRECNNCIYRGGNWTALGCIYPDLKSFIQYQVFGFGIGIAGTVALGCIIYSAFLMQTSAGEPEKITKAQELMTSCIIGLIVVIFSVFILRVIGVDILRIPGMG
ncbi:MAG: hypothetical protein IAE95_00040 [Chitinophagaceae bacterium]|nr:hypothetical protein [Chitinophagaceae bacterium]